MSAIAKGRTIDQGGRRRDRADAPDARRAEAGREARLQVVQELAADYRTRLGDIDRARGSHLDSASVVHRLQEVRGEIVSGLHRSRLDAYWGELAPEAVLRLVDKAIEGPVVVRSGRYNLGLGVKDDHGRGVALMFGRDRIRDGVPRPREGVLEPVDAMAEAHRLGVRVPQVLFALRGGEQTGRGSIIEVHAWVDGNNLEERHPLVTRSRAGRRPLPEGLREQAADMLVKLGSTDPVELLARYPGAPRTCGERHLLDTNFLFELEERHWEQYRSFFEAVGLDADTVGVGDRSRFPHPEPDLSARLVHGDIKRTNWMLTAKTRSEKGKLELVDFDDAHLGDPLKDVVSAELYAIAKLSHARQFEARYKRGMAKADPEMIKAFDERINLFATMRAYRAILNLPAWIDLALSQVPKGMDLEKTEAFKQETDRVDYTLELCQPYLGNRIVPGGEIVRMMERARKEEERARAE